MEHSRSAYLYALPAVALWSTVATAFKLALQHQTPWELLFYATLVSAGVLTLVAAATGKLPMLLATSPAAWRRSLGLGFLNPLLYYAVLFQAYHLLPAQVAQPLNYTWAITLAILSVPLLGRRLSLDDAAGLLVSYTGVVVISGVAWAKTGGPLNPLGIGLALASTIVWSLYWICHAADRQDPVLGLLRCFLVAIPLTLLLWLFRGPFRWPSGVGLCAAAYVGTFEMGLTYLLWLVAMRRTERPARVSSLIFLSPFLSLVLIHYVVGETMRPTTVPGLTLIVAGILLQQYGPFVRWRSGRPTSPPPKDTR